MARFVVTRAPGPAWDAGKPTRGQPGWDSHARCMDNLADEGFVTFGGPAADGTRFVFSVGVPDERAVRARLAPDPWEQTNRLRTVAVKPWTIWLGGDEDIDAERPLQLVWYAAGPRWNHTRQRRQQAGWQAHAEFMDALAEQHLAVLGGPLDERRALVVMQFDDEPALRARLAADPWAGGMLTIAGVDPWTLWLRASRRLRLGAR